MRQECERESHLAFFGGRRLFMHREWAKVPLWQKVSKLFSTSLCLVAENELNFWKAPVRNDGRNLQSV